MLSLFCLTKCRECVRCFARLRDNQHSGVAFRVCRARDVFACVLNIDRKTSRILEHDLRRKTCMAAGAAGSDDQVFVLAEALGRIGQGLHLDMAVRNILLKRARKRVWLLVYLAKHRMLKLAIAHRPFALQNVYCNEMRAVQALVCSRCDSCRSFFSPQQPRNTSLTLHARPTRRKSRSSADPTSGSRH